MTDRDHTTRYPIDSTNQVKRRHDRGFYDHLTVHALLDAAMLCHVSYVIEGQPFCTPTFFWREGTRLYWHGSSASRMLGEPEPCPRRVEGVERPEALAGYSAGRPLEDALSEAYRRTHGATDR